MLDRRNRTESTRKSSRQHRNPLPRRSLSQLIVEHDRSDRDAEDVAERAKEDEESERLAGESWWKGSEDGKDGSGVEKTDSDGPGDWSV